LSLAVPHAVEIDRLGARYGATTALEDITLAVRSHEALGVIGRRGAGKTSLLKAVLGLLIADAGSIRVFGEPNHTPGPRSRIAYLPQRFRPPGDLLGQDYLRLTLAFHGRHAKRPQTAILAEQIDLDPAALDRPIRSYAKGMVQKLGLLAMLLADRPLLVLDEPLSGLDPGARRMAKRQLSDYRARGRAILGSSAIPSDHEELCDRVAVLHEGRLRYLGSPADLRARHGAPTLATAFLAEIAEPDAEGRGSGASG
jgi:ABC-2 type transport system ATP-binding protein